MGSRFLIGPEPKESKPEEGMGLEASELARWTRFAAKGGIGKCTATCDCVAESVDDLMFFKGDEITVLLQLPDKENLFLGYCEGVVGHFLGSDVHFHAKLKVPVKAKRVSMASRKSPTPDIISPIGQPSPRPSSSSKIETELLERRVSQQRRVQIPSRMQPMEDESQQYPPSMTFSSSSPGTDSLVTTPALGYFSSPEIKKSSIYSTPSPRDAHFSIEAPRSKSVPPIRTSSPPTMPVSHSHAAMIPTHAPIPPHLMPESTTPLRINKRMPASPSAPHFSPSPSLSTSQLPSSSSIPNTSYDERSKRNSTRMSDVEVGIGMSLLQDLANGMDSDSDDDDGQWSKPDSVAGTSDLDSYAIALSRVGHKRDSLDEGTQESTVDGLGYDRSEEDYEEKELSGTAKHAVVVEDTPSSSAISTRRASPDPSNPNTNASHNPNAVLPSSTSPTSPSFSQSSFPTNERRPSLVPSASSASEWEGASDIYDDYRYSRYSMASKMSRFSSSAGWTGSAPLTPPLPDSNSNGRTRTDSSKSRPESSSISARSRTDSMNTRLTVDSLSTPSEMKAVAGGRSSLSSLPLLPETSEVGGGQEPQGSQQQDLPNSHLKRTTIMKERTMSMESAASVYTQNSRLSTLSQDLIAAMSSNQLETSSTANNNNPGIINTRPPPLSLSQSNFVKSPLLHTSWSTPLSDTTAGPSTGSPVEFESSELHTPMVGIVPVGSARAGVSIPLGFTEDGKRKGSSDVTTPGGFGHGGSAVGIASALRQRLETEQRSPTLEQTQNQQLIRNSSDRKSEGLGHQIVVEDEDELPSRILDSSTSTFMSLTTTMSPEPIDEDEDQGVNDILEHRSGSPRVNAGAGQRYPSSSPEPDLMLLRTHLAPLTVMNRTPSPSAASDEGRESRRAAEADVNEEQEQERDQEGMRKEASPIMPTTLDASPPPHLSVSSSTPGLLPRLSSASGATIRMGSPPIDLRPSLALSDIREPGGPLVPGSNQRRSLFLPHPGAPKSLGDGIGGGSVAGLAGPGPGVPMYIAAQQQPAQQGLVRGPGGPPHMMMPPANNVIGVIRMALTVPPRAAMVKGQGQPGQGTQGPVGQGSSTMMVMRGPTIYGHTETDLSGSLGPIPIVFSIDPPSSTIPASASNPTLTSMVSSPSQGTTTSKPTMPSSPTRAQMQMMTKQHQQESESQRRSPSLGTTGAGAGAGAAVVSASTSVSDVDSSAGGRDVTPAMEPKAEPKTEPKTIGGFIPRPNFFPKLPGLRPRSRSFSSFNSNAGVPPPLQRSTDEARSSSGRDVKRSLTTSVSSPLPSSSLSPVSPSRPSRLASIASIQLSPLSLPPHNAVLRQPLRSPTSPLAQSIVPPPVALPTSPNNSSLGIGSRPPHQLRETSSRATLNEPLPPPTIPGSTMGRVDSPPSPSSPRQSHGHTSIPAQSRNDGSSRASDADAMSINSDTRSQFAVARQPSLRTKLSLPNLRRNRSKDGSGGGDSELLQVKDMEFELVKPNLAHFRSKRDSEDSAVLGKHSSIEARQDGSAFLRAESPAASILSGASKQSPSMNSDLPSSNSWGPLSTSTPASRVTTDAESSMDAHRNREIKWMSLMSSNPASQARKSKKVRKLLMDGVPSSVRYLVWSYLTDGKARCVQGVYTQLCSRGRVPSSADIERDIKSCFQDQPHLQGTQGPVLLLLQAYLNMVPDIQYTMGLTLIVGQLLLLAPEEDAFWIFISIMDTHIRPYFSTVTTQMEVDSALFSRALESNDNQVARKILVDMGISPPAICQPWFSSLFVGTLPPEYLNRIWDLFLFEGIPFLLRVALAIVTCCRLAILESTSEEAVLQIFRHPQPSLLPPSPDAFLSLVCSVKLKDDDVRKQRIKMEAQVKRQTQVPRTVSTAGGISLPRT